MWLQLAVLVTLIYTFIAYLRQVYSRFSRHGVAYKKPLPFIGNVGRQALRQCHLGEELEIQYKKFSNERFYGWFELLRPVLVIRDPELIKQVTVKDYEYFLDHRTIADGAADPLFGRNLFSLKGQEWKDMRSTLSPVFTSSKIRSMVPFMVEANNLMINAIKRRIDESKCGYIDVECKDLTTRYTNDVIASCAFGIKVDSHSETNNDFYVHGRGTASFGFKKMLVYLGYSSFPSLMKKLKIRFFDIETYDFFKHIFMNTMMDRQDNGIFRSDLIHLLLQAKNGQLSHDEKSQSRDTGFATVEESDVGTRAVNRSWSEDDLVAQAMLFFVAGFETVSSAMCFLLHELALNPEVQNKLVKEIQDFDKQNGGFDYSNIPNLKYMDMVVSEILRLWPAAIGMDRLCLKDYNMGKPNAGAKKDYIIRKGELIMIPLWSIHRDPTHFENPNHFDPERFSDENKHKIKPFTFIPFGSGPRSCIGSRFALCEVKVMTYQLLLHFEVSPCEKTSRNSKLATDAFTLCLEGGFWVRLRPRKKLD